MRMTLRVTTLTASARRPKPRPPAKKRNTQVFSCQLGTAVHISVVLHHKSFSYWAEEKMHRDCAAISVLCPHILKDEDAVLVRVADGVVQPVDLEVEVVHQVCHPRH